jgi:hypothetical protein
LSFEQAGSWLAALPFRWKMVALASIVVLVELALRRFAPASRAYRDWTRFFRGVGSVWTAVLLAVVYLLSVGPVGLFMRLFGSDPLDRRLEPAPSYWRSHEPNPLGPLRAARHQF